MSTSVRGPIAPASRRAPTTEEQTTDEAALDVFERAKATWMMIIYSELDPGNSSTAVTAEDSLRITDCTGLCDDTRLCDEARFLLLPGLGFGGCCLDAVLGSRCSSCTAARGDCNNCTEGWLRVNHGRGQLQKADILVDRGVPIGLVDSSDPE